MGVEAGPVIPPDGVIRSPGSYRLDRDIAATAGNGIQVHANDVVLDLGGHRVGGGPSSFDSPSSSVDASAVRKLTIRNGTLVGGWFGLALTGARKVVVEDVAFVGQEQIGLVGTSVRGITIARCRLQIAVTQVPKPDGERYAIGLNLRGRDIEISGNEMDIEYVHVQQDDPPVETIAILIGADSRAVRVTGNRITAAQPLTASYGIWGGADSRLEISGNRIENVDYGIAIADDAVARVRDNAFACRVDGGSAGIRRAGCTAAMFARSADLRETGNRIEGYAADVTRYDPVAAGH